MTDARCTTLHYKVRIYQKSLNKELFNVPKRTERRCSERQKLFAIEHVLWTELLDLEVHLLDKNVSTFLSVSQGRTKFNNLSSDGQ